MQAILLKYRNYLILLILLILLITLKVVNPSFIKSISYLSFDLYQKVFPLEKKDSNVVIVDIDEKSLIKFGQFPWSRSVFAKILEKISATEPKAIGFDIFFTEKDKQSPEEIIKAYDITASEVIAYLQNIQSHDEVFRQQLETSKSVIAVLGSNVSSHGTYDRSAKAKFLSKGGDPKQFTYSFSHSIGSLEKLEKRNVSVRGRVSKLDNSGKAFFLYPRFFNSVVI